MRTGLFQDSEPRPDFAPFVDGSTAAYAWRGDASSSSCGCGCGGCSGKGCACGDDPLGHWNVIADGWVSNHFYPPSSVAPPRGGCGGGCSVGVQRSSASSRIADGIGLGKPWPDPNAYLIQEARPFVPGIPEFHAQLRPPDPCRFAGASVTWDWVNNIVLSEGHTLVDWGFIDPAPDVEDTSDCLLWIYVLETDLRLDIDGSEQAFQVVFIDAVVDLGPGQDRYGRYRVVARFSGTREFSLLQNGQTIPGGGIDIGELPGLDDPAQDQDAEGDTGQEGEGGGAGGAGGIAGGFTFDSLTDYRLDSNYIGMLEIYDLGFGGYWSEYYRLEMYIDIGAPIWNQPPDAWEAPGGYFFYIVDPLNYANGGDVFIPLEGPGCDAFRTSFNLLDGNLAVFAAATALLAEGAYGAPELDALGPIDLSAVLAATASATFDVDRSIVEALCADVAWIP